MHPQMTQISPIEAHRCHLRAESSRQTKSNLWMNIQVMRENKGERAGAAQRLNPVLGWPLSSPKPT